MIWMRKGRTFFVESKDLFKQLVTDSHLKRGLECVYLVRYCQCLKGVDICALTLAIVSHVIMFLRATST